MLEGLGQQLSFYSDLQILTDVYRVYRAVVDQHPDLVEKFIVMDSPHMK